MTRWTYTAPLLAVCLSAAPAAAQLITPMPGDVVRSPQAIEIQMNRADTPVTAAFELPPARLWPLALLAYIRTGLRVSASDPARRRVDTKGQILWNQLRGHPLSDYFDCGRIFTGPIADRWRLRVDAQMAVLPREVADSSGVVLVLSARAEPTDGTASTTTPCTSLGRLETALATEVRRLLPDRQVTD